MCVDTKTFYVNSRYLSPVHFRRFIVNCSCGKCVECRKKNQVEWQMRAYYEALNTFENYKNSFVLFDTLSYSDNNVTRLSDYEPMYTLCRDNRLVFNGDDITLFIKRLRRSLEYDGYNVNDNLKYFIVSEYGSDDVYRDDRGRLRKATLRPHYHVLFYVRFLIDPLKFSRYISAAWQKGRTDGLPYKKETYILSKRVFTCKSPNVLKCVNYVAKYVNKSSIYEKKVRKSINDGLKLFTSCYGNLSSDQALELKNKMMRKCLQFHRQSRGFGDFAFDKVGLDNIINRGKIPMYKCDNSVIAESSIPASWYRRIFQEQFYYHGRRLWRFKPDKLDLYKELNRRRFNALVNRYYGYSVQFNMDLDIEKIKCIVDYAMFYRGRIYNGYLPTKDQVELFDISSSSTDYKSLSFYGSLLKVFNHHMDVKVNHDRYVSFGDYKIDSLGRCVPNLVKSREFVRDNIIDDTYCPDWFGFDKILDWFDIISKWIGSVKQRKYEDKEQLKCDLLLAGFYTGNLK